MANKVQLKAVGEQDTGSSDPFAELTRIMGFDPRVQPTPRPEDHLDIDLEKELMGEFDAGHAAMPGVGMDNVEPAQLPASAARTSSPSADTHAETDDFEAALAASFEEHTPSGQEPPVGQFVPQGRVEEPAISNPPESAASAPMDPVAEPSTPESGRSSSAYTPGLHGEEPGDDLLAAEFEKALTEEPSEEVPDRGPELASSLNSLLTRAGYKTGSSLSGTAQVYPVGSPYIRATPEPADDMAETLEEAEPAVSAAAVPPEAAQDPFAVLASLGEEDVTPAEQPAAVSDAPLPEAAPQAAPEAAPFVIPTALSSSVSQIKPYGRFDGAARFYSSPNMFSRATPVAPGARAPVSYVQPSRAPVSEPVQMPAEEPIDPLAEHIEEVAASLHVPVEAEPFAVPAQERRETMRSDLHETPLVPPAPVLAREPVRAVRVAVPAAEREVASISPVEARPAVRSASAAQYTPDIETIDVPEPAVALADDLDIPVPPQAEEVPSAPSYDELDHDFIDAFSSLKPQPPAVAQTTAAPSSATAAALSEDEALAAKIDELFSAEEFDFNDHPAGEEAAASGAANYTSEAYAFQDDYYDAAAAAAYGDQPEEVAYPRTRQLAMRDRRGPLIAGIMGCVVIVGAAGAFAFSHHGLKGSGGPVLLKADAQPIKMKPKHPGGIKVPNQDSQVYNRVADGDVPAPVEQQKLISNEEQPLDVNAHVNKGDDSAGSSASSLPGVEMPSIPQASKSEIAALSANDAQKNQDRVPPSAGAKNDGSHDDDVIAVLPRKVRTMIVKPDGTMVPNSMPEPAPAPKSVAHAALEAPVAKTQGGPAANPRTVSQIITPKQVKAMPGRPAEQPAARAPSNEKVASLGTAKPAAATAASSGWAMQIASQPTAAAAQTSYQRMAHRYGSVLSGHGVDIVKADISGKGTYYRVRVPAPSREEAIELCTKYRAAGGSCFVTH